jgi:hypothetical protein
MKTTKKQQIAEVEAKIEKLWAEYHASTDADFQFSLLRLETAYQRELQQLMSR